MDTERKYRVSFTDAFIFTMYLKLKKNKDLASSEEIYYNSLKMVALLEKCGYKVRKKMNSIDLNSFLYQYKDYVDYNSSVDMFQLRQFAKKDFVEIFNVKRLPVEILDAMGFTPPHTF